MIVGGGGWVALLRWNRRVRRRRRRGWGIWKEWLISFVDEKMGNKFLIIVL